MNTPGSALHRQVDGTFIGPVAPHHDQPRPAVVAIDWNAYDVPRLWDIVRREDDETAWQQVRGFENLAQLLLSHHDRLRGQRDSLSNAWDPDDSPAAAHFFALLDRLLESMAEDAVAHASTSRALHAILTALKTAKEQMGHWKRQWDRVTTDWSPEWWDHAAGDLNRRARELMARTDAAVGDHRRQLFVPRLYSIVEGSGAMTVPEGRRQRRAQAPPSSAGHPVAGPVAETAAEPGPDPVAVTAIAPPPIPGHDPVLHRGPELSGLSGVPRPVAAVPGAPISLLPVPPGNGYAPGGGAYVLPGPGIGRGRWIYPMPPPPQPVPMHKPAASTTVRPGKPDTVWQIASGVPPVIEAVPDGEELAEEQLHAADEAFADWFADLATPWTDDLKPDFARTEPSP